MGTRTRTRKQLPKAAKAARVTEPKPSVMPPLGQGVQETERILRGRDQQLSYARAYSCAGFGAQTKPGV